MGGCSIGLCTELLKRQLRRDNRTRGLREAKRIFLAGTSCVTSFRKPGRRNIQTFSSRMHPSPRCADSHQIDVESDTP
jgi:hypothetical protein